MTTSGELPEDDRLADEQPVPESASGGDSQPPQAEMPASQGAAGPPEAVPEEASSAEAGNEATAETASEADAVPSADDATEPEREMQWYILKVQVNREETIRDALMRRVKVADLEECFGEVIIPTEDVAEYNKAGKRRIAKRKLYPGYLMIHMVLNEDTWFLVRETPGIGDFTGSAGKPTPMEAHEVDRIIFAGRDRETGEPQIKTAIPFKTGDRVRVKEGNFLNFEGDVEAIDEANGRVTVMINIFGRSTPVELEHWQIESI